MCLGIRQQVLNVVTLPVEPSEAKVRTFDLSIGLSASQLPPRTNGHLPKQHFDYAHVFTLYNRSRRSRRRDHQKMRLFTDYSEYELQASVGPS